MIIKRLLIFLKSDVLHIGLLGVIIFIAQPIACLRVLLGWDKELLELDQVKGCDWHLFWLSSWREAFQALENFRLLEFHAFEFESEYFLATQIDLKSI